MKSRLSLLTFNTLGTPFFAPDITKRYKKIAHLIKNEDYDIVCLQEIFTYYHLYVFKRILTNYPSVIFQKNPFGPRGGLVIFSKHKLVEPKFFTFTYPDNTYVPLYTKAARLGILSAQIEQIPIHIFTTHLSSDVTHDLTSKNKLYKLIKNQSEEAANLINTYSQKEKSLIIC